MCDGAADRAPVAHLGVAHQPRHVRQQRNLTGHEGRRLQGAVPGEGAHHQLATGDGDPVEPGYAGDVDEDTGGGEPQFHDGQQRVAPGEQSGIVTVLDQGRQRLVDTGRRDVAKRGGDHEATSVRVVASPCSAAQRTERTIIS